MGKVTSGVFPVNVNQFEVNVGASSEENWVTVAELEEVNVTIDNNTETWKSFANGGWESALGQLQNAVRQGGFAVVDVCDDAEIADVVSCHLFLQRKIVGVRFMIRSSPPRR